MNENGNGNGNGNGNSRMIPAEQDFVHRLERSFDSQEKEFQKTRDDVNSLKNQQNVIQRDISSLTTGIQALSAKMDERNKTNWPALALAATLFIATIPGLGFVMASYTANAISPVSNATVINAENLKHLGDALHTVESAAIGSQAADLASKSDRLQLNDRVRTLESNLGSEVADRRANSAAVKVALAEIESQFHALSNVENLRAAQQERLNSMMWEKSHPGERYPNGTFFPTSLFSGPNQSTTGSP